MASASGVSETDVYRAMSRDTWRSPFDILELLTGAKRAGEGTPKNIHPGEVIFHIDEMVGKLLAEHRYADSPQGEPGRPGLFRYVEYRLTENGAGAKAAYS